MKVLFLDIDGVLNHDGTEERIKGLGVFTGFLGLDKELVDRFVKWLSDKDYRVVLSSSWRQHDVLKDHILESGVFFYDVTPRFGFRGEEIENYIQQNHGIDDYAILDDIEQFHSYQYKHLVLTDPTVGVTDADLKKVDEILNG